VLRACRRLLRPGGGIAFYTIFIPPGLSESAYRRALKLGPAQAASRRREHQELLRSAGFVAISEADITSEFLRITRQRLEARERHSADLRQSLGDSEFEENQSESRAQIEAIEAGLLQRSLFVAERPR
jgi:hypothetical protein